MDYSKYTRAQKYWLKHDLADFSKTAGLHSLKKSMESNMALGPKEAAEVW